jgi:hypothetical protein
LDVTFLETHVAEETFPSMSYRMFPGVVGFYGSRDMDYKRDVP